MEGTTLQHHGPPPPPPPPPPAAATADASAPDVQAECEERSRIAGELIASGDLREARHAVRSAHTRLIDIGDSLPARSVPDLPRWYRACLSATLQRLALFSQIEHDPHSAHKYLEEALLLTPRSGSLVSNIVSCLKGMADAPLAAVLDAAKRAVTVTENLDEAEIYAECRDRGAAESRHSRYLTLAYYHYCTVLEMCLKDQARRVALGEGSPSEEASLQSRVHAVTLAYAESLHHLHSGVSEAGGVQIRGAFETACARWSAWVQQAVLPFPTSAGAGRPEGLWESQVACAREFDDKPHPPPSLPFITMVRKQGGLASGRDVHSATPYLAAILAASHPEPSRAAPGLDDYSAVTQSGGGGTYTPPPRESHEEHAATSGDSPPQAASPRHPGGSGTPERIFPGSPPRGGGGGVWGAQQQQQQRSPGAVSPVYTEAFLPEDQAGTLQPRVPPPAASPPGLTEGPGASPPGTGGAGVESGVWGYSGGGGGGSASLLQHGVPQPDPVAVASGGGGSGGGEGGYRQGPVVAVAVVGRSVSGEGGGGGGPERYHPLQDVLRRAALARGSPVMQAVSGGVAERQLPPPSPLQHAQPMPTPNTLPLSGETSDLFPEHEFL